MRIQDTLALTAVLSLALGIMCAPLLASSWAFFLFLVAVIFLCGWFFGRRDAYLFPFFVLAFFAFGMVRFDHFDTGVRSALEDRLGETVSFTAKVSAAPDERETNTQLTIRVPTYDTNVLLIVPRYPEYHYGDLLSVKGKLVRPEPFDTDDGRAFAYDTFLEKDGIAYVMRYAAVAKEGEDDSLAARTLRGIYAMRSWFEEGLQAALSEPSASLASGILLGGKQGLGKALLDAFTVTGLLPIVVLSGYNIMIVIAGVLFVLSRFHPRISFPVAAVVVTLFVVATGMGTSAIRALLMGLLALVARALGRIYDALRILIAVFAGMILWNPYSLLYDPGFQFSFIATLGLVLLATPIGVRLMKIPGAFMREVAASTIAAQLFVLPLLLYQTGNLSTVSLLANALVLPVVPAAMLLSFIAGLAGGLLPNIAIFAGTPAWFFLSYMTTVASTLATVPFAHLVIPAFPAWVLLPSYAAIGWFTLKLRQSAPRLRSS